MIRGPYIDGGDFGADVCSFYHFSKQVCFSVGMHSGFYSGALL